MKLSIGMIVKNEEKYLERCLNGIKPILDNVDSELIITDTGSTDRTVEIAQKFTDKIIHFEWIKDFAAARNTAFSVAKGEWFMFIDADEILESCNGIINFFNSGDYKKYKSASFIIRNLYDENEYIDFYPRRMVKRFPETKFIGMIHEYLYPIIPPSKHIPDVALHYGYLYQTFEETKAKFERNIELMLKTLEMEEDPHPKIYSQLFDGYGSVFDYENAYKYIETGIEKCKNNNDGYIVILYAQKTEQLYRSGRYDKTYDVCEEYFSQKKIMKLPPLTTDGDMYAYEADSLFALGRCEEAIGYYKKYFDTYREIKSGRLCTEDMYQKTIEMCSDRAVPGIFNNFTACCINAGKFNTADMYFTTYPLREYIFEEKALVTLCSRMITVLENLGYKNIAKYASQLDEKGLSLLTEMMFVRLYITGGNEVIYNALKKITTGETSVRADIFYNYLNAEYSKNVLHSAVIQITKCGLHSLELCKMNCGRLFMIESGKCIEDIAEIGLITTENGYNELTGEMHAAVILSDCIKLKNSGQIKACISKMKDAVKEYEPIAPLVSEYCNAMIDAFQKAEPMSELDRLAATVKNNIINMIKNGKLEDAKKTLEQYHGINPADPDIALLKKMIEEGDR